MMLFLNQDCSYPDGTYQFSVKHPYYIAIRIPKSNEENQNKQYYISKQSDRNFKLIAIEKLIKLLETL